MSVQVPIDVKKFIDQEIPKVVRRKIVPLVKQAYELVDASMEDISFLKWILGKLHRGYLEHIAVQFTLYEAAREGKLGEITAQVAPNIKRSSYHVELKSDNVIICINRADRENVTARKAIFRSILQKSNQLYWTFGEKEVKEEPGYLELTHNYADNKVSFVNLGVPDGKGKWYDYIDLTKELHLVDVSNEEKKNEITKEQLVKFKDFAQGVQPSGGNK